MKKVLIIGINGFIGQHLCKILIKRFFRSTMVVANKLSDAPTMIGLNGRVKQLYKN